MSTEFGTWLKEHRVKSGISARELARRANVSATYVSRLETLNETCVPSVTTMCRFAKALGIDEAQGLAAAGRIPLNISAWLLESAESWATLGNLIDQGVSIEALIQKFKTNCP